uniref:Uncharacterized protein n=1 Tax=Solanum lycopersicum TaxID=4081 RepID=K4CS71_SOLLC
MHKKICCHVLAVQIGLFQLLTKSWRRKANFPFARAENSTIVPLLATVCSTGSVASRDGEGSGSVKRYAVSIRIIWLKLGRMLGSSTQHDCMINAKSGEISSGRLGLSWYVFGIFQFSHV